MTPKEALTNALCHRDYFENGAKIMVELYDDRLEISSPGGLLSYVAQDFGHRSRSRNPLIFRMFTRMHLVESVGTGIPRIARILSQEGFPPAEYKTEGFFAVVLRKKANTSVHQSVHSGQKSGQKNKKRIVELMRRKPSITTGEIASILDINRSAAMRHIDTLKKEGTIERKGPDRGGEWIVLTQ